MRSNRFAASLSCASRLLVCLGVALTLSSFILTGCGGGGSLGGGTGGGGTTTTVTSVTVTPATATLTAGASQQFSATVAGTGSYSSAVTWSVSASPASAATTISATGNLTTPSTITAVTTATITATSVGDGTKFGTATVTINPVAITPPPAPTITLTANPSSIVSGSSSTLTVKSTNATTCSGAFGLSGTVTCNGTITVTPSVTSQYSVAATGPGGTNDSPLVTVTVTLGAIELTSITPPLAWYPGGRAGVTETLKGTSFPEGGTIKTVPSLDISSAQLVGSTQANIAFYIASDDDSLGYIQTQVCQPDGTGCSTPPLSFALYGPNMFVVDPKTGEGFGLNPTEVVGSQQGFVDKFTASGAPDGNFFVGIGSYHIAVDDVTEFVLVDGNVYNENGGQTNVPAFSGGYEYPVTALAAKNGLMCLLQPTAPMNMSCVSLVAGAPGTTNPVLSANVGTDQQSLTMGVTNGVTYAYSLTAPATGATIWKTNASTMTSVSSNAIPGISAGAPGGSGLAMFDSLGVGMVASWGDGIAIVFNETTLEPTMGDITLPGSSIVLAADTANGVALVGSADMPNLGGTFSTIDPTTGKVTAVAGAKATFLPVGLTASPAGKGFSAYCRSVLQAFTLP